MSQPVIFLAFANDEDEHLPLLDKERKRISELLITLESQQYIQLHGESSASIDDIFTYLNAFKNRVAIFHYGGHANSTQLMLQGQKANASGITGLLSQQKQLKLVFLNGCSTYEQVQLLLDKGIPAVIATSVPIEDNKAVAFSTRFYEAMVNQHSLEEAFELASAYIKSTDEAMTIQIHRGAALRKTIKQATTQLPWGLYVQDEAALDWKLPNKSGKQIIIQGESERYNTKNTPVNERLTNALFDVLAPFSEELEFFQFQLQKGKKIDVRRVRRAVMDTLPAPVGEQVRKLFAADPDTQMSTLDTISVDRLEQLVLTYNTLVQLLTYTMMAQLWDTKVAMPDLVISEACKQQIEEIFTVAATQLDTFDYIEVVSHIHKVFDDNNITCFIQELEELRTLFSQDEEFQTAYTFMESMKQEVKDKNKIPAANLEVFCLKAEEYLGHIFKYLGFTAKYKLSVIKGIDLLKERHKAPAFRHYKVKLDHITAGYLDSESVYPHFVDDKSVILLKSYEDVERYLSLSPFILDENALRGEKKSKLFFFSYYDKTTDTFHYHFSYNKADKLVISDEQFPEIKAQFQAFTKLVLDKKIKDL